MVNIYTVCYRGTKLLVLIYSCVHSFIYLSLIILIGNIVSTFNDDFFSVTLSRFVAAGTAVRFILVSTHVYFV